MVSPNYIEFQYLYTIKETKNKLMQYDQTALYEVLQEELTALFTVLSEGFNSEIGELNVALHTSVPTDMATTEVKRDLRLCSLAHTSVVWDLKYSKAYCLPVADPKGYNRPVLNPPASQEYLVCSGACHTELSAYM